MSVNVDGTVASLLVDRTLALCRIPSPIGEERAIADHLETWARRCFPPSEVQRLGHSLVLGELEDPRPTIALVGHLDTVPAHPGDRAPRVEGDRIVGLGSSDMKGGLAVMMTLAESLPRATLPVNLVLVLYEREEGPYLESGLRTLLAEVPALSRIAFAIAMEPTDSTIQVGCVGSIHATVRFQGRSAHSARPWQGENAIHKAGPVLTGLLTRPRTDVELHGLTFHEVMSATLAQGGRARNVVPDSFSLNLNYRFAPGRALEDAKRDILDLVAGQATVEFTDEAPSAPICAENQWYRRLVESSGLPVRAKQAWTDVARLMAGGIDAVNLGPGETAQAHQADESAPAAALSHTFTALARFLRREP